MVVLMVCPARALAQDGTAKWLRNLWVTIGSTGVTHSDLQQPSGFQGSDDHANGKAELAPRVEYDFTGLGRALMPVLDGLQNP